MITLEQSRQAAETLGAAGTYGHFINGEWVDGNSGETIALFNPATRKSVGAIQSGDAVDVDRAVNAAHAALSTWAASSARPST